jgi:iron uptake system EfeUOB component EfeO/EfeM
VKGRASTAIAAACLAVAVFLVFTALGVGDHTRSSTHSPPTATPFAVFTLESPHVLSGYSVYTVEGLGGGLSPSPAGFAPRLSPSTFEHPISLYRRYAVAQLGLMKAQIQRLRQAMEADDRAAAKVAWRATFGRYLHLGAVYLAGQAAELNEEIDGTASGLPGGVSNVHFSGLHRIEYGLWTGAPPRTLLGFTGRLDSSVRKLRSALPGISITPLEYATRAHEILEDALRDFLSGAEVTWSGEGVLATEAGVQATEEVLLTLHPFLASEDSEGGEGAIAPVLEAELTALRSELSAIASAHGGRLPSNQQLTQQQSELLEGALGGALEALAQVPEALEVEPATQPPRIPRSDVRIVP